MDNNDKLLQDVTKKSHVSASNVLKKEVHTLPTTSAAGRGATLLCRFTI
jgi:hypothetical protein